MDSRTDNRRGTSWTNQDGSGFEVPAWLRACRSVAFDIETDASVDIKTGRITAMSFSDGINTHFIDSRGHAATAYCAAFLHDLFERAEIVGHNLSFDLMFVREVYGVPYPARLWDTQIAEQLLTAGLNDLEVGLDDVAYRRCGVVLDKSLQLSFGIEGPFTKEQEEYSVSDVRLLHAIKSQQEPEIIEHELEAILQLEFECLPIFAEMVRTGVGVDLEELLPQIERVTRDRDTWAEKLQADLTPAIRWKQMNDYDADCADLNEWLENYNQRSAEYEELWNSYMNTWSMGVDPKREWQENPTWMDEKINKKDQKPEGMRRYVKAQMKKWRETNPRPSKPALDTSLINLNSPLQLTAAFKHLGIDFPNFRATTIATVLSDTQDETLREMLTLLLSYKKAEKLLSSFGEPLVKKIAIDGRLHGNFRQIGTATGRPSCSSPNMLQMPKRGVNKKFRKVFVPRDMYLFVRADYSQMELRLMAQMSGDKVMQKAFNDDVDLHTYTASLMFKTPMEKVTDDQRATAKTINFGILYGMGPNKLRATLASDGIHMSKQDAYNAVQLWKRTYYKAASAIQAWGDQAFKRGWTATAWGRKRYFDTNITERDQEFAIRREGANHPIQGGNADITKMAMVLIDRYLDGHGTIVLNVYDEIVVEVQTEFAWWARKVVEQCMNLAASDVLVDVPSKVEAQVTRSWSETDALPLSEPAPF
jgi:DNA polymerase I-like protein with 3'-5' exonuclease and polymerase domains